MHGFWPLLVLMVVIWTAGRLFKIVRLPEVFGELIGGIIVGPALLQIVDAESETIRVLAELGAFFLMIHTGLKIDPQDLLRASVPSAIFGAIGMAVPFVGTYLTALVLGLPTTSALFLSLTLSVTALPLAARILKDTGTEGTRLGHATLGAAIIMDIVALIVFSLLLRLAESGQLTPLAVAGSVTLAIGFVTMVIVAGVAFHRWLPLLMKYGNRSFTVSLILALCIGVLAEEAGLHLFTGGFLAGLFIREEVLDPDVYARIEDRYYGLTYGLLAPIFFASLAFHFDLTVFLRAPVSVIVFTLVAIITKVAAGAGAALLAGFSRREALVAGLALNTRGAVELIIAAVGLETGMIDEIAFSVLITAAFLSTLASIGATALLPRYHRLIVAGKPF